MPRLIKRYGNRKLYDTQESRYVTLEGIAAFVKQGEEVQVVDNDTGEDLTAVTFAQIILEQERRSTGFLPLPMLRKIIQQGEATLQDLATRVDRGVEALGSLGERAGRRVQELVGRGAPQGKALLEDIFSSPQRRLEALQKRIDERVKKSVERITSLPAVQRDLARIERSIARLEERLGRLRNDSHK
ncbi:MAG: polyhydroxyalkanoate synthesis regulator DNA-binding domain-containing protein [Deltaproteobacteria bacterium]|nr:polyhydroxyalkanoate synthesis regulator DNA-binding domain-containing protein [Deltaproteobacteria bacterium]